MVIVPRASVVDVCFGKTSAWTNVCPFTSGVSGENSRSSCVSSCTAVCVTAADPAAKTSSLTYEAVNVCLPVDGGATAADALPSFHVARAAKAPLSSIRIPPDGTFVEDVEEATVTTTDSPGC